MCHFPRYCVFSTAVLAMILLAVSLKQRLGTRPAASRSLDDWDIRELADELKRAGLELRLLSTRRDGVIDHNAFLTTTDKDWDTLNRLGINPGPSRIPEWRGVVYCECSRMQEPLDLIGQWGGPSLAAGPFALYGDAELLQRIRAILVPSAAPTAP